MSGCDIYIMPGMDKLQPGLWYPGPYEANIPEIMNINRLAQLRKNMQRCHGPLDVKSNRVDILKQYCEDEPDDNPIKERMFIALGHKTGRKKIQSMLNEPTFEAFKVLKLAGVPMPGDVVFSSTATANSGNNDAVTTALDILGCTENITYHRSSTVSSSGMTGVSNVEPKNEAVKFDEHCQIGQWDVMVRHLGLQFLQLTQNYIINHSTQIQINDINDINNLCTLKIMPNLQIIPCYDRIYHWGCISQSWTHNYLGNHVSQWAIHEEWNVNMTVAMMWHATMTAKAGGQVCLKIRIFKRAETLGLTTLFSNLFENCTLTENSRQTCYFAVGIFNNMTHDTSLRLHVASILWSAMDQRPEKIFQNDLMLSPRSKEMLSICTQIRDVIVLSLARYNSAFLVGLRCLVQCFIQKSTDPFLVKLKPMLDSIYNEKSSNYFLSEWIKCFQRLKKSDIQILTRIMQGPWMQAVC